MNYNNNNATINNKINSKEETYMNKNTKYTGKDGDMEYVDYSVAFMKAMDQMPLLEPEQEQELLNTAVAMGKDSAEGMAAASELATHYYKLIKSVAGKFPKYFDDDVEDMCSEAYIELCEKVFQYNPEKGSFYNYANLIIRRRVTDFTNGENRVVRLPKNATNAVAKVRQAQDKLANQGVTASDEAIAGELGASVSIVKKLRAIDTDVKSLDGSFESSDGETFSFYEVTEDDKYTSVQNSCVRNDIFDVLHKAILELEPEEQLVIALRFGFKDGKVHTLESIGKRLGKSRERIRQIENKALKKLGNKHSLKGLREALSDANMW